MKTRTSRLVRPLLVLGAIVAWLAIAGVGGPTVGKLGDVQENDNTAFLPLSAESSLAAQVAVEFTPQDTVPALFVVDGAGESDIPDIDAFVADALAATLIDDPRDRLLADVVNGDAQIVSAQDGTAVLVVIPVDAEDFAESLGETSMAVIVTDTLNHEWEQAGIDLQGYVTGPVGLVADLVAAFAGIDGLLLGVALSAVLIILLLVYRSPVLPFIVLITALSALAGAVVVVYALAAGGALVLNGQSQGIMFILVVGATTDYALLIVSRYREELRRQQSTYSAIATAWKRSLEPIAASAITVILGLLMLLLSDLRSNASLGPVAAIGIVAAVVAALTFLPALLLIGGTRARGVYWPSVPHYSGQAAADVAGIEDVEKQFGVWGVISRGVSKHPRRTWVAATAGLLGLSAFLPMLDAGGAGEQDVFLVEVDSVTGLSILERSFDAGQTSPVEIYVREDQAEATVAVVRGIDGVEAVYLLTPSVAQGAPPGVVPGEPPVVVDSLVQVRAITEAAASSREATDVVSDIRDALVEVAPGALVGGDAAQSLDTRLTTSRDLSIIIPAVLAVIFVVLIALLRSVVAPAVIVVANILSFGAALGLSALIFTTVFGFESVDPSVVLFGFVFLVALGVDYSIFLMSRVREESLRHGTREGVRRGLTVTGGVITSAGIVLAATFAALAVLPLSFLFQLAFLVALGVLIDTFVVRTLLVPGAVYDIGRLSWWPWHRHIRA